MASPFEAGQAAGEKLDKEIKYKKLYKKLLKKVHLDKFHFTNEKNGSGKWADEASELTKEITFLDSEESSWESKLEKLREIEARVKEFSARVSADKEAAVADADSGPNPEQPEQEQPEPEKPESDSEQPKPDSEQPEPEQPGDEQKQKEEEQKRKEKTAGAGPAGPEEEASEKEKNLKELEKQLDEARRDFIGKDIGAEEKASKFWKLFRVGNLGEYAEEHKEAKSHYQETLKGYKDEYLKVHGLNEKTVAEMVTFFNIKEHLNLDSARRDAIGKNANWPKKAWNMYMGMIDRYRKIGENDKSKFKKFSKKMVAGMFVAVAAAGAATGGGAIAGVAGSIAGAALVRGFTISVSSAGFKAVYEGLAQSSKAMGNKSEVAYISRNLKDPSAGENYYDQVLRNLDAKANSMDEVMQEQKKWKRRRTFAAVGTAGMLSAAGRYFGGSVTKYLFGGTESHAPAAGAPGSGAAAPEMASEHLSGADLSVVEGRHGGIEATISKYLAENPDVIKKYNEQLGGGRKFDAGQIAYRMFDELSKNHNAGNVPPGAQVHLTPDGLHIEGITGFDINSLHEKAAEAAGTQVSEKATEAAAAQPDAISAAAENNAGIVQEEVAAQPDVEVVPDNIENPEVSVTPENANNAAAEAFDSAHGSVFGHKVNEFLNGAEREMYNAERGYGGNYGPAARPTPGPGSAWLENMAANRNFFSAFRDHIISGKQDMAVKDFQNEIAQGDSWDKIKDLSFSEAAKNMNWRASEKMAGLFKNMRDILGDSIKPKSWPAEETMEEWTKRVAETAIEQANKKY